MNWIREAKEVNRLYYGGYVQMCNKIGQQPVPYHNFTDAEYHRVRKIVKPNAYK